MTQLCRDCGEDFNPNDRFWDITGRKGVQRLHREVGFIDQCGDCGLEDDNPATDRVIALEEGDGAKGSCQVTPMHPEALGGRASGMGRYVTFSQRYQPIGCKR